MKSLFKKSLTLVLVAVLMFLMVSCVHGRKKSPGRNRRSG